MVPALLKKLPQNRQYSVYFDNLFISTRLLKYLHNEGFGATGTAKSNAGIYINLIKRKKEDAKDVIP